MSLRRSVLASVTGGCETCGGLMLEESNVSFEDAPDRRMTLLHLAQAFLQSNALSVKFCRFSSLYGGVVGGRQCHNELSETVI